MILLNQPKRCAWVPLEDQIYIEYHDEKWGVPVHDDIKLFAMLTLEGAQAGLSWKTILDKREGYTTCFANFDIAAVANFDEQKIYALSKDCRIIRNVQKIRATVHNARCILNIQEKVGSFNRYIWSFVDHKPIVNCWNNQKEIPASTPLSIHITKQLKKQGFKFVGPTIIYAYMQAIGMVNDHVTSCFRYKEILTSLSNK